MILLFGKLLNYIDFVCLELKTPSKQWFMSITFRELMYIEVTNILLYWCMIILYAKCQYLAIVNWFSCGRGEENKRSNNIRSLFAIPTPTQLISILMSLHRNNWTQLNRNIQNNPIHLWWRSRRFRTGSC